MNQMNATRLAFHEELVEILGNRHVYFQPPKEELMEYPCIRYSLTDIDNTHADDRTYLRDYCFNVILIHPEANNCIVDRLSNMQFSTLNKIYTTQGLNHYVFTIYYKKKRR